MYKKLPIVILFSSSLVCIFMCNIHFVCNIFENATKDIAVSIPKFISLIVYYLGGFLQNC